MSCVLAGVMIIACLLCFAWGGPHLLSAGRDMDMVMERSRSVLASSVL